VTTVEIEAQKLISDYNARKKKIYDEEDQGPSPLALQPASIETDESKSGIAADPNPSPSSEYSLVDVEPSTPPVLVTLMDGVPVGEAKQNDAKMATGQDAPVQQVVPPEETKVGDVTVAVQVPNGSSIQVSTPENTQSNDGPITHACSGCDTKTPGSRSYCLEFVIYYYQNLHIEDFPASHVSMIDLVYAINALRRVHTQPIIAR
jgi:hypothetical protein